MCTPLLIRFSMHHTKSDTLLRLRQGPLNLTLQDLKAVPTDVAE